MKPRRKTEDLLNEMLADNTSAEFGNSMLLQMVRLARQRQRIRRWRQATLVMSVAAVLAWWAWRPRTPEPVRSEREIASAPVAARAFDLLMTQPLPPAMLVNTQTSSVRIVASSTSVIALVSTRRADDLFREVDDDQLLAMLKEQPVALIRYGPHEAALVMPEELLRDGIRIQ